MPNWEYDEELKMHFYPFQPMTGDPELQELLSALAGNKAVRERFFMTHRDYEDMYCGGASIGELFEQVEDFVGEFLAAVKERGVSFPSGITEERVRRCLESSILHWHFSVYGSGGPPRKKAKTQQ